MSKIKITLDLKEYIDEHFTHVNKRLDKLNGKVHKHESYFDRIKGLGYVTVVVTAILAIKEIIIR